MLEISCALATSLETPSHVVLAEELGYRRAWLYDSPALYPDTWAMMALAAQRTSKIGLGPGVLIPSLRHPMVTASAIATIDSLAPGRVEAAIGSGFTGRLTMGQRPLTWSFVRSYVRAVKALLHGGTVVWEGRAVRMMHSPGFLPDRPLNVPLLLGTGGPKGLEAARELADGVFISAPDATSANRGDAPWRVAVLMFGTVLAPGEDPASERTIGAAGHAAAVRLHGMWERDPSLLASVPGGPKWISEIENLPEEERHLAVHHMHLVGVNDRDRPFITGQQLREMQLALSNQEWQERLRALEEAGATEIAYQPAGPDIQGELRRFAQAAGL